MPAMMVLTRRELAAYFASPLAPIYIVIFLITSAAFAFFLGGFFQRGQADLSAFFQFHPWIYMIFLPALTMRLWSDEIKSGSLEILLSLPVSIWQLVLGKFLASWLFVGMMLVLSFPFWITVNYLGMPDNGIILSGYLGSWLMAGGYLAIGACLSALTQSQVIAFILAVVVSFILTLSGSPLILEVFQSWAPDSLLAVVAYSSFITHFQNMSKGVIELRDLIYFVSLILFFLYANILAVNALKRG